LEQAARNHFKQHYRYRTRSWRRRHVLRRVWIQTGMAECHVIGNSIPALAGTGISVLGVVKSAMIKNNFIDGAFTGGIVIRRPARRILLRWRKPDFRNCRAT
jgi:hypothetical protein